MYCSLNLIQSFFLQNYTIFHILFVIFFYASFKMQAKSHVTANFSVLNKQVTHAGYYIIGIVFGELWINFIMTLKYKSINLLILKIKYLSLITFLFFLKASFFFFFKKKFI